LFTELLWRLVPGQLEVSTRIIGYPTFYNFDVVRYTDGYYFITLVFPALVVAVYAALSWRGPLRRLTPPAAPLFPLHLTEGVSQPKPETAPTRTDDPSTVTMSDDEPITDATGALGDARPLGVRVFWAVARVLVPALAVVVAVSAAGRGNQELTIGGGAGFAYVAAVGLLAVAHHGANRGTRRALHGAPVVGTSDWLRSLSWSNALLAIVVVPLLLVAADSSTVYVRSQHRHVEYGWLPVWLVVLLTLCCLIAWARGMKRARGPRETSEVEANVLTWLVGPAILYLSVAALPMARGRFFGYDDAEYMAAPQLVFGHGLLPWRDLYVLHGVLEDVLGGGVGMALFGNNRWGVVAGVQMVVGPLTLLSIYAFAAYFCRKNRLVLVALVAAAGAGLVTTGVTRFLLYPVFFILLDRVLRRPSWWWCGLFGFVLLAGAILTPEEVLFVPFFLLVVVAFEATQFRRGVALAVAFPRTIRCACALAVVATAWLLYLIVTDSFSAFVGYFPDFGPGYTLEGGVPVQWNLATNLTTDAKFFLPILLWLATVWRVVAKLRLRRPWRVNDWLMIAAASCSVVYFPKALGRAEAGHVYETFVIAMPLALLWVVELLRLADRRLCRSVLQVGARLGPAGLPHLATGLATVAVLATTFTLPQSLTLALRLAPERFHPSVPVPVSGPLPRLGYTLPGTVDTSQILGLRTLLHRYAGTTAPVYDFSNDPGILYYLLNRVPGTRFFVSNIALTSSAQHQVISDLQKSRPPVVVESSGSFGLPNYDGIPDSVRSYAVAAYLFGHYRPWVNYQGQLLLVRKDLVAAGRRSSTASTAANVAFSGPTCNFGYVPNFFALPPDLASEPSLALHARYLGTSNRIVSGWAMDPATGRPTAEVVAVADARVVASGPTGYPRPDVAKALHTPSALDSGFGLFIPVGTKGPLSIYGLSTDGHAYLLQPGTPSAPGASFPLRRTIVFGGRGFRPAAEPIAGGFDSATTKPVQVVQLQAPGGVAFDSYPWLRLKGTSPLGYSTFTLSNVLYSPSGSQIRFQALPRSGNTLTVDVDSCLQWHSYRSSAPLYLIRSSTGPRAPVSASLIGGPPPS